MPPGGGVRMEAAPAGQPRRRSWACSRGDVIKKVNGQAVASTGDLARLYRSSPPPRTIQAEVQRGDATVQLSYRIQPETGPARGFRHGVQPRRRLVYTSGLQMPDKSTKKPQIVTRFRTVSWRVRALLAPLAAPGAAGARAGAGRLRRAGAAAGASPRRDGDEKITVNFVNADIQSVIKTVGQHTGKQLHPRPARDRHGEHRVRPAGVEGHALPASCSRRCACRATPRSRATAS